MNIIDILIQTTDFDEFKQFICDEYSGYALNKDQMELLIESGGSVEDEHETVFFDKRDDVYVAYTKSKEEKKEKVEWSDVL